MTATWIQRIGNSRPRIFNNPIILRELVTQLRKFQSFFFLLLFLVVAVQSLVSVWPYLIYYRNTHHAFQQLSYYMCLFLALLTPLLSATAVNSEYERNTWDMLLTTKINLSTILWGKILSSFLFVWILFLSIIPVFSLLMPFGGVSPSEILVFVIAGTEIMVISTLVGLFCSIRFRRQVQAIFVSYIICSALFFLPYIMPLQGIALTISPFFFRRYALDATISNNPFFSPQQINFPQQLYFIFHGFAIFVQILVFLMLCAWYINPELKERMLSFCDRVLKRLMRFLHLHYYFDIYWFFFLFCIPGIISWFMGRRNLESIYLSAVALNAITSSILIAFWLHCNHRYYQLWQKQPWGDVDTTPQNLRRFLFQHVGETIKLYLFFLLALTPLLFVLLLFQFMSLGQLFWIVLSLVDCIILLSAASLYVSINKSYYCQSLYWSFLLSLLFILFIPRLLMGMYSPFFFSPLNLMLGNFVYVRSGFIGDPFSVFFEYSSSFIFYYIYAIIIFVILILLAQRRVLKQAGVFKDETVIQWLRRTLMNLLPQKGKTPPKPLPPIPDGYNPVLIKELREYLLAANAWIYMAKWLGALLCVSILFMVLRSEGRYYPPFQNPYLFILLLSPLLVVPYAANAMRREKDQGVWEILLTTTLHPTSILNAKMATGLILSILSVTVLLWPLLASDWGNLFRSGMNPQYYLLVLGSYMLLTLTISIFLSALAKKTLTAYIASFSAVYLILLYPSMMISPFHILTHLGSRSGYMIPNPRFPMNLDLRMGNAYEYSLMSIVIAYLLFSCLIYLSASIYMRRQRFTR